MGIDVILESEFGERIMELPDPKGRTSLILALADKEAGCLAGIDQYGMTVFNRLQIPQLIRELEKAKESITENGLKDYSERELAHAKSINSPPGLITVLEEYIRLRSHKDVVNHLDGILTMARKALTEPHQYLRFSGD
jgi:hypothetical protein